MFWLRNKKNNFQLHSYLEARVMFSFLNMLKYGPVLELMVLLTKPKMSMLTYPVGLVVLILQ